MDFQLSKEQELLQRAVREFARAEIAPRSAEIEEQKRIPQDLIQKMGKMGFFGAPFPQEYGGAGVGLMGYCLMLEELGKVSTSVAVLVGAHIGIGSMAIYLDGTEEQKRKYLVPLARGEKIAAFALTEPGAGSDAASIQLSAVRQGDHYLLNGSKIWITNGPIAEVISLFAVTDKALGARGGVTAFIIEKGFPGFSIGTVDEKMGIEGSATGELVFEDCRVPAENILGQVGAGFLTAMKTLDYGRLSLGAGCLGGAQAALQISLEYAKYREQFGQPIAHKQAIQFMVADTATEIEALRSLLYRTIGMAEREQEFRRLADMCKLFGSEVSTRAVDRAVQIHGGMGYMQGYPVERMYRDSRITEIFEGTSEIQRIVIATDLFRELGIRIRP